MKFAIVLALAACAAAQQGVVKNWIGGTTDFGDPTNWDDGGVPGASGSAPSLISFSRNERYGAAHFLPVSSVIQEGNYGFGTLAFPVHGQLTFSASTRLHVNPGANGGTRFFTAAQDPSDSRYDFSCHSNWEGGNNPSLPPCQNEIGFFSPDHSYSVAVAGRHHVAALDFSGVRVESNDDVQLLPRDQVHIAGGGTDLRVSDSNTCDSDGFIMYRSSGGGFTRTPDCQCYSTCASDTQTLQDNRAIRHSFRQHANQYHSESSSRVSIDFDLTLTDDELEIASPLLEEVEASGEYMGLFGSTLGGYYSGSTSANFTVLLSGGIRVTGRLRARSDALQVVNSDGNIWQFSGDDITNRIGRTNNEEQSFLLRVHDSLQVAAAAACEDTPNLQGCDTLPAARRPQRYTLSRAAGNELMIGARLPNSDVLRVFDDANYPALRDALVSSLEGYLGIAGVEPDSVAFRVNRRHVLGAARSPVYVSFAYWSYDPPAGAGAAAAGSDVHDALQGRADNVLIRYEVQSHHSCFSIDTGYDDVCIQAAVDTAYRQALANGASRDEAVEAARDALIEIRGCGLDGDCDLSAEELDQLNQDASAAVAASAASASTSDGGGGSIIPIVVAAVVVILIIVVVVRRKGGDGQKAERSAIAFENPVYENKKGGGASEGLYDEPAFSGKSNPMYDSQEDLTAAGDAGGYLDVEPESDEEDE